MLPIIMDDGWRFGFIAKHASQYLEDEDPECVSHYLKQLEHMVTGHKIHVGKPELKKQIEDLLNAQISLLKNDDIEDIKIPLLG